MDSPFKSSEEVVATFLAFYEAAVHFILYSREVYPAVLFEKRQLFGVYVWRCRHPLVIEYVRQAIDSLRRVLISPAVDRFLVVIKDAKTGAWLEHYSFSVRWLLSPVENLEKLRRHELENLFRSFLLKVAVSDSFMAPITEEKTFEIVIRTGDAVPISRLSAENFPWVPCDLPSEIDSIVTPLKDLKNEVFQLQFSIEDHKK